MAQSLQEPHQQHAKKGHNTVGKVLIVVRTVGISTLSCTEVTTVVCCSCGRLPEQSEVEIKEMAVGSSPPLSLY